MPIVSFGGCLQILELGEHPCPVTVDSHERGYLCRDHLSDHAHQGTLERSDSSPRVSLASTDRNQSGQQHWAKECCPIDAHHFASDDQQVLCVSGDGIGVGLPAVFQGVLTALRLWSDSHDMGRSRKSSHPSWQWFIQINRKTSSS